MTLFQWQDYTEKIAVIMKMFQPTEPGKDTDALPTEGGVSTAEKKRLIQRAREVGIKPPGKGL